MRNAIWCGCVAAAATALMVYGTARYAQRCPDSMTAKCWRVCYRCASDWNPLAQAGQLVGSAVADIYHRTIVQPIPCPTQECPEPACTMEPPAQNGCIHQVIDLTTWEQLSKPECDPVCQPPDPAGATPTFVPPAYSVREEVETVPPAASVSEEVETVLPTIEDENPVEPMMDLVDENYEGDLGAQPEGDATSTTTPEELPMPKEVGTVDEPNDPDAEESESMQEGTPPDCEEDHDYHHRYPECPYSGGCPGSKQCPTPPTPVEEPAPEKSGAHGDVDTMEFRPSDAKPGEFDAKPIR